MQLRFIWLSCEVVEKQASGYENRGALEPTQNLGQDWTQCCRQICFCKGTKSILHVESKIIKINKKNIINMKFCI